jgi:hypothetical protein
VLEGGELEDVSLGHGDDAPVGHARHRQLGEAGEDLAPVE